VRDALWWLAADAWAIERAEGNMERWASTYDYPAQSAATARLFDRQMRRTKALRALLCGISTSAYSTCTKDRSQGPAKGEGEGRARPPETDRATCKSMFALGQDPAPRGETVDSSNRREALPRADREQLNRIAHRDRGPTATENPLTYKRVRGR